MVGATQTPPPADLLPSTLPTSKEKPGDRLPSARRLEGWGQESPVQLPQREGAGCWAGQGFPPPQERAWGCHAAPEAQTGALTPPPKADPLQRYLLKCCSLGAPWLKLEDGLVGHLDGRAVLPSPPRRGARQTLNPAMGPSTPGPPSDACFTPVTRALLLHAVLPAQTSHTRPGTAPCHHACAPPHRSWKCLGWKSSF